MKKGMTDAEIMEKLHKGLKLIVGNLKAEQKKLRKLRNETKNVEAVLHSAIDDALFHLDRSVSNLEEEIDS